MALSASVTLPHTLENYTYVDVGCVNQIPVVDSEPTHYAADPHYMAPGRIELPALPSPYSGAVAHSDHRVAGTLFGYTPGAPRQGLSLLYLTAGRGVPKLSRPECPPGESNSHALDGFPPVGLRPQGPPRQGDIAEGPIRWLLWPFSGPCSVVLVSRSARCELVRGLRLVFPLVLRSGVAAVYWDLYGLPRPSPTPEQAVLRAAGS